MTSSTASDDNDIIIGGFGADAIYGGNGHRQASYVDSHAGVFVSLLSGTGSGGTAQGDTLDSIENLTGSSYDDTLVGDDLHNAIAGLEGADHLKGGGGDDRLYGQAGDDMLKGGGGEDILSGFTGIDTAAYNQSAAGVNVYLTTGSGFGGDAEGDYLDGIENLIGSSYKDQLWGDNGVNLLKGMTVTIRSEAWLEKTPCSAAITTTSCSAWPTTTRSTAETATTHSMAVPAMTP